jgi:hypothetical protein
LHAAGRNSIYTAFRAVDVLSKYGYVTIANIKTSRLERKDDKEKGISKIEIVVKRTSEFEQIYQDYAKKISEKFALSKSAAPTEKARQSSPPPGHVQEEVK